MFLQNCGKIYSRHRFFPTENWIGNNPNAMEERKKPVKFELDVFPLELCVSFICIHCHLAVANRTKYCFGVISLNVLSEFQIAIFNLNRSGK